MSTLALLIWIVAGLAWGLLGLRKAWRAMTPVVRWYMAWRRARLDDRAKWVNYRLTDFETGQITIGIELITPDRREIGDVVMKTYPEHTPDERLIDQDELAMRRAIRLNAEQTPERKRMYRRAEQEASAE